MEARIAQPIGGRTRAELEELADQFIDEVGLQPHDILLTHLKRGIFLGASPDRYARHPPQAERPDKASDVDLAPDHTVFVNDEEWKWLERERQDQESGNFFTRLGSYPRTTYLVIFCCSLGAIVQGFDETAVNGGQIEVD